MLWTLYSSFKTSQEIVLSPWGVPESLRFDNYSRAWTTAKIGDFFFNTVLVVGLALIINMVLGSMCAYVLARYKFAGRRVIYYVFIAGLTFPIFLAVIPLFFTLKGIGLQGSYAGLILTYVAFALPFTVFFLYSFFLTLPQEIQEAAAIDGAGDFKTFFLIMLPMAKNGIVSVTIFNFLGLWNQYLLPLVLNTDSSKYVLSQGVASMAAQQGYSTDWGGLFAAIIITIVPVLVFYLVFQRQLQGGVSQGTMK
ncbi:carbohydrate ABC transporter permease [Micrococcales bacterium 31B]|nr:carbohydrate ABC transporter permease [Micrococcales bacterium 31B]